jgi:hypothetical protein
MPRRGVDPGWTREEDVLESRLRIVVNEVLTRELGDKTNIAVMVDESLELADHPAPAVVIVSHTRMYFRFFSAHLFPLGQYIYTHLNNVVVPRAVFYTNLNKAFLMATLTNPYIIQHHPSSSPLLFPR